MKKFFIGALSSVLAVAGASASVLMTGNPQIGAENFRLVKTPAQAVAKAPAGSSNTWFEGFEGRPDDISWSSHEWLPTDWQEVSMVGTMPTPSKSQGWNLTWQVATNETITMCAPSSTVSAYQGEAFAFIMCDVAYDGHTELATQDEWLMTPPSVPTGDDWLYFKLYYRPGWVVFNRDKNDFSGLNNSLQIYASTDEGANWEKIWDLVDDEIKTNLTEADLRADMSRMDGEYHPIYVNIKKYLGKSTMFAFRYYGSLGQPMALDNIAVGVPQPVASYILPGGFFYQAVTPTFEYPVNPKLLIPQETEATWVNTSTDILSNEWSYSDASGASATTADKNLVTPAYPFGATVDTPVLTGYFEQRASEPYTLHHKQMQVGGYLTGSDGAGFNGETSVGTYDILDCTLTKSSAPIYTFCSTIDEAWEMRLGKEPGSVEVLGLGVVYDKPAKPYGFDFAEVGVFVKENVADNAKLDLDVIAYNEDGTTSVIGHSELYGTDIPKVVGNETQTVLRFKFPTPVYVDKQILIQISGLREAGTGAVELPYLYSMNPDVQTKSFVIMNSYNQITGSMEPMLGNLSTLLIPKGYFAGHLISVGASYAWMETEGDMAIDAPVEGSTTTFSIKAFHNPDRWSLTEDGLTVAKWAEIEDATLDEATNTYSVKIKVLPNADTKSRDTNLYLASPGTRLPIKVTQPGAPAGIDAVADAQAVSVKVVGKTIEIVGGVESARIYTVGGALAASAPLKGGKTVINVSNLAKGVYIVKIDGSLTKKVIL